MKCTGQECLFIDGCSAYTRLFENYNFWIRFANQAENQYLRVPIATFATDAENGYCMLHISSGSAETVIGSMFF